MPDRRLVSRRTALGLAALAVTATACDVDDLRPPDDATPTPTPTAPDELTADEKIVEQVVTALGEAVVVLGVARKIPEVRQPLGGLMRAHRAHLAGLDGEPPARVVMALPTNAESALQLVRGSEKKLHGVLVDAATRAESGALARLLASASASISQHLVVLG